MNRNACWVLLALGILASCSSISDGEPVEMEDPSSSSRSQSSGSTSKSSSSNADEPVSSSSGILSSGSELDADSLLSRYTKWAKVPASTIKRGTTSFSVSAFEISVTEVTQALYLSIMDSVPVMAMVGDSIPVANVNWYDAVLFCNALSKKVGLDTAYIYETTADAQYLQNLSIDYSVESVRMPTEMEWESAYRAGTTTTYYWDRDEASGYAYYGQSNGPVKVAERKPNALGLFDMAGNVAEWTNDWLASKPTLSQVNYTGAETGKYKVVRGGGWSDKVRVLAADSTTKKDPLYRGENLGLRLVHSVGF